MHKEPKVRPVKIRSVNASQGEPLNDLESALLCVQKLIGQKQKEGKKGMTLYKGTESETKVSYNKLQGLLWEIHTYFAMRGAFSHGTCGTCVKFDNGCSEDGTYGYCNGKERYMVDSCTNHEGGGGFGKQRD